MMILLSRRTEATAAERIHASPQPRARLEQPQGVVVGDGEPLPVRRGQRAGGVGEGVFEQTNVTSHITKRTREMVR